MTPAAPQYGFHRLAIREYLTARRYYARRKARAALRFQQAVEAALQQIVANPAAGSPFRIGYRWVRLRRYPYLLYYEDTNPRLITIMAVAHERRRPGYWFGRVGRS